MVEKLEEVLHKGEQSVNNEPNAFTNPDNGDIIQEEDGGKGSGKRAGYGKNHPSNEKRDYAAAKQYSKELGDAWNTVRLV